MPIPKYKNARHRALALGYRSGLEETLAAQIKAQGQHLRYETTKIPYTTPPKGHTYTPDFILDNGIHIEGKGRFLPEDRQKHLLIREQHPDIDIRFVFSSSKAKIGPGSKTTLAAWCTKNGFQFADRVIPIAWFKETQTKAERNSEVQSKDTAIREHILTHLLRVGSLTQLVATKEYQTTDLRDHIYRLRRRLAAEDREKPEEQKRWIRTVYRKSPVHQERYTEYVLMVGKDVSAKQRG